MFPIRLSFCAKTSIIIYIVKHDIYQKYAKSQKGMSDYHGTNTDR